MTSFEWINDIFSIPKRKVRNIIFKCLIDDMGHWECGHGISLLESILGYYIIERSLRCGFAFFKVFYGDSLKLHTFQYHENTLIRFYFFDFESFKFYQEYVMILFLVKLTINPIKVLEKPQMKVNKDNRMSKILCTNEESDTVKSAQI